jgi:disulfide bond formation protein DsbB
MKKSLRLLFATIVMAAAVAAATTQSPKSQLGAGIEPCPMCPPGGCSVN